MSRPRVLLVEDDPNTLAALGDAFADGGYDVAREDDGARGLARALREGFDVIVSDVNLPGLDGFSLCRRLRAAARSTPLILLTSRDSDIDEALGLELGADDYVTKPFSLRVLRARLAGLLRRANPAEPDPSEDRFVLGPLVIDRARLTVRWHGALIDCTVTELRIIEALATRAGRVLSREKLLELGREDRSFVAPRIIDTYVARLRKKLDAARPESNPIETVVGAGYRYREGR
jgi:DNA-binding response OmpR family regulator